MRNVRSPNDGLPLVSSKTAVFRAADVGVLAIWFGLAGGIVEALFLLVAQRMGWMKWESRLTSVDHNILWVSPSVDLAILLLTAALVSLAMRTFPKFRWQKIVLILFTAIASFAVLSVPGRIHSRFLAVLAVGFGFAVSRWKGTTPKAQLAWFRKTLRPVCAVAGFLAIGSLLGQTVWEHVQLARLPAPQPGRPSILFIVLDTLRADRLGSYGYRRQTAPFLDEVAWQGVRFEKAIAPSSWTLPSQVSMFTGRLPSEHGATTEPYDGRFATLAEVLASKGYATAGFVANSLLVTRAQGMDRGFIRWENIFVGPVDSIRRTSIGRWVEEKFFRPESFHTYPPARMDATEINRRFLRWLDSQPKRPFFVYLNYMEMHEPYDPPPSYASRFLEDPNARRFTLRSATRKLPSPEDKPILDGEYDASLAYLDSQLRLLFRELQHRKLEENVIVVITSDHGQSLLEHGLLGHRISLHREQIHVPLLIVFPPKTPQGRVVTEPVGLESLPATLLDLAGLDDSVFPAQSLVPLWTGTDRRGASEPQTFAVAELAAASATADEIRRQVPFALGWVKSVVTSEWHFILQQNGKMELYNWESDPRELQNLADSPEGQPLVSELRRKLRDRLGARGFSSGQAAP